MACQTVGDSLVIVGLIVQVGAIGWTVRRVRRGLRLPIEVELSPAIESQAPTLERLDARVSEVERESRERDEELRQRIRKGVLEALAERKWEAFAFGGGIGLTLVGAVVGLSC